MHISNACKQCIYAMHESNFLNELFFFFANDSTVHTRQHENVSFDKNVLAYVPATSFRQRSRSVQGGKTGHKSSLEILGQ